MRVTVTLTRMAPFVYMTSMCNQLQSCVCKVADVLSLQQKEKVINNSHFQVHKCNVHNMP